MADKKTPNIGLTLTTDEKTLFKDWRDIINGEGTDENPSNAQIVDKAIGALSQSKQDKIDSTNKLDFNLIDNVPAFVTASVDNLTNYYKKSEIYTKDEVNHLVETIDKISFKKVNSVEEVTEAGYIYLVPSEQTESDDIYKEYIFIDNKPELIGSTKIDLSDYYTKDETEELLENLESTLNDGMSELIDGLTTRVDASLATKQDKIDEEHKLSADLIDGDLGTKVEANPEGEAEEKLTTLKISDKIYELDGGWSLPEGGYAGDLLVKGPKSYLTYTGTYPSEGTVISSLKYAIVDDEDYIKSLYEEIQAIPADSSSDYPCIYIWRQNYTDSEGSVSTRNIFEINKKPRSQDSSQTDDYATFIILDRQLYILLVDKEFDYNTTVDGYLAKGHLTPGFYKLSNNGVDPERLSSGIYSLELVEAEKSPTLVQVSENLSKKQSLSTKLLSINDDFTSTIITKEVDTYWENSEDIIGKYNYSAGNGIKINSREVSIDTSIIPVKSDLNSFITRSVNDLYNYYKKSETYTKDEVNDLVETIDKITFKKVASIEEVIEAGYIYLVPSTKTELDNIYDEYIFIDDKAELIGSTKIDLSDYYNKDEIDTTISGINDKLETVETVINNDNITILANIPDSSNIGDVLTIDHKETLPIFTAEDFFNSDAFYVDLTKVSQLINEDPVNADDNSWAVYADTLDHTWGVGCSIELKDNHEFYVYYSYEDSSETNASGSRYYWIHVNPTLEPIEYDDAGLAGSPDLIPPMSTVVVWKHQLGSDIDQGYQVYSNDHILTIPVVDRRTDTYTYNEDDIKFDTELIQRFKGIIGCRVTEEKAAVWKAPPESGSNITPNPDEEATESLTKIKINNTVYGLDFAAKEDMAYLRSYIDYLSSLHSKIFVNTMEFEDGSSVDKLKFVDESGEEFKVLIDNK